MKTKNNRLDIKSQKPNVGYGVTAIRYEVKSTTKKSQNDLFQAQIKHPYL